MKDYFKKWIPFKLFGSHDSEVEPLTVYNPFYLNRSKHWKARAQRAASRMNKKRGIPGGFEHPRLKPEKLKKKPKIRYVK